MAGTNEAYRYEVVFDTNGNVTWKMNGQTHRHDDKPARIYTNGTELYYKFDQVHREKGPAKVFASGRLEWWQNDGLHNLHGPAVTTEKGFKAWYIRGKKLSETDFKIAISPTLEVTVADIEKLYGHKIKIVKG